MSKESTRTCFMPQGLTIKFVYIINSSATLPLILLLKQITGLVLSRNHNDKIQ